MKKILFFSFFLVFSSSLFAQNFEPFTWQYPKYGAHAINCTRWITGQNFIAVGDAGTVLLSNDDGLTWQRIEPFTDKKFRSIAVVDSLTLYAVASYDNNFSDIYKSSDGGFTWNLIYNTLIMSLRDIHFVTDSIGYAVGNIGKVVKTVDAGNTWIDFTTASLSGNLRAVYFLNPDTGFVGRTNTTGAMFKTENGGLTWSQVFGYGGQGCYTIKFLNDTLGYAGAYNSRIFRTTNAGATWSQQTTFQTNEEVTSIDFANLTNGVAVTSAYVYRTTNGTSWSSPYLGGPNFLSAAISPSGNLVLGDSYGGLRTAQNFGTTYTNSNPQSGLQKFQRIKFADAQNGWVAGEGYNFLKTTNGGNTWTVTNPTYYVDYVNDMAVLSPNKVIIVAGSANNTESKVITTTNGGSTFTEQIISPNNALTAVSFPSATTGYIVGNNGVAFKTTNGGASYTPITTGITNNHTEVFFVTDQLGYVVGEFGDIRKTINSGSTWTQLNISGMGTTKQIYFTDILNGYTVNENGAVFRTTDGGTTFTPAGQTCLQTPFDMQFINDSTGFVVGSFVNASCDVSYTTNFGQTWNSMTFPYQYAGWGVFAFDTANVYLVGQNQSIIKTSVDGVVTSNQSMSEIGNQEFNIYPNPSKGIFEIDFKTKNSQAIDMLLEVYHISGQLILSKQLNATHTQLDLSEFSKGLYILRVTSSNTTKSYKISKE